MKWLKLSAVLIYIAAHIYIIILAFFIYTSVFAFLAIVPLIGDVLIAGAETSRSNFLPLLLILFNAVLWSFILRRR